MGKEKGKLSTTRTIHVSIDTGKCVACWECVDTCLEQVIGKVKNTSFSESRRIVQAVKSV